jgi:hypothetical protein
MEAQIQAANQMIAEKDAFVRKTFHEIRTPCHILLQVSKTRSTVVRTMYCMCTDHCMSKEQYNVPTVIAVILQATRQHDCMLHYDIIGRLISV